MANQSVEKFILVASHPDSLLNFRGPLIRALLSKDLEVHVAAPDLNADSLIRRSLESYGVNVHKIHMKRTGMNPISDLRTIFQLWILMKKIKPNYFLGYTHKPVIYGNLAAWMAGVNKQFALITGLGYTFQSQILWLNHLLQFLYRISMRRVEKVFFQNPDDETLFQNLGIIKTSDQKSVVVNGSGVDLKKFNIASFPKKIQFLLIARLLGDKGVREYFKAAKAVRKNHPDIKFGLVGWIDNHPDAISKKELDESIDAGDIFFYGRMDDVKPAISESSVYVLPSYREGTPRTVLEAMAMGRPIITTDAPGCKETVKDGINGYIVKVKSSQALVEAMLCFIEQPELIESMGNSSRKIAEEKYDVDKVNKHMMIEMGFKI
tara:strand:- start:12752 stop:13885 length:1134 start_codon:yes stop_codon:yes gene_type:complete